MAPVINEIDVFVGRKLSTEKLTLSFALPCRDHDTIDAALAAQVHHPDRVFDEVVI